MFPGQNNFFTEIKGLYDQTVLYKYEAIDGRLHKKTGLNLAGAYLGRLIRYVTYSIERSEKEKYVDLFEKVILQSEQTECHRMNERVLRIESSPEIRQIAEIFRRDSFRYSYSNIFEGIPQEKWSDLLKFILSLGCNREEKILSPDFMETIRWIPQGQRIGLLHKAQQCLLEIANFKDRSLALAYMKDVEDLGVIEKIASLFLDTTIDDKYLILQTISTIPRKQLTAETIEKIVFLFQNIENTKDISNCINNIPEAQRADVIVGAANFFDRNTVTYGRILMLNAIKEIDPDERADVVKKAALIVETNGSYGTCSLIHTLRIIPQEEREDVVEQALPILQDINENYDKSLILGAIAEIPQKQRADAIKRATSFFTEDTDPSEIESLIRALGKISQEQRGEEVIEIAAAIFSGTKDRGSIILALADIPQEEREDVIQKARPLFEDFSDNLGKSYILQVIGKIPQEQRAQIIELSISCCEGISNVRGRMEMIHTVSALPPDIRKNFIDLSLPFLKNFETSFRRAELLNAGILMMPSLWNEFCSFYISAIASNPMDLKIVENFFKNSKRIKENLDYLNERLTKTTDQHEARRLASGIIQFAEAFYLPEENPLFQKAVQILTATDNPNDPKSPYRVYADLMKASQEPMPNDLLFPREKIGDHLMEISIEQFQEYSKVKRITFGELPEIIDPKDLFKALEMRLENLGNKERQKIKEEVIPQMTASDYDHLYNNFINDALIQSCLHRGNSKDPAPPYLVYFSAIMKFIADQSNEILESGLTLREETLLKISASIQNCSVGKKGGISIAYNHLPEAYRLDKISTENPETYEAELYLFRFVQELITNLFSTDNKLMQELIGVEAHSQHSHQSLYIKNFIGARVGLAHIVEFDIHAQTVESVLLNRNLKDTLEIFYKHFTPSLLVQKLKEQIDRDQPMKVDPKQPLKEKALYHSLTKLLLKKNPETDMSEIWEMDEDDIPTGNLTSIGAREILAAQGLLKNNMMQR